jgi:ABC-type multidrug transport system fused ATPase/permease subunit
MDSRAHYVAAPPTPKSEVTRDGSPSFREQKHPLRTATLLSQVFMTWLQPLITLGATRALETEDVWAACPRDTCTALQMRLKNVCDPLDPRARQQFNPPLGMPRIMFALIKTFRKELVVVFFSDMIFIAGQAVLSLATEAILDFLNGRENRFGTESGYPLVVILSLSGLVAMLCFNYAWFVSSRVGVNMRSLLMDLVYQKSLRLSSRARQQYTTGEIVTLMSVDTERVFNATLNGPWIVLAPISFVVAVVLIGVLFDVGSAVAGAALLVAVVFISSRLAKRIGRAQKDLLPTTEQRVKVTSEALQGIRVMKFYAWTESLARRIDAIRYVEVGKYRRFHLWQILNSTLLFLTPVLLSAVALGVFVAQHSMALTVTKAYTLLAIVNVTRQGVNAFPLAIAALSQASVVCHRIDAFLAGDELTASPVSLPARQSEPHTHITPPTELQHNCASDTGSTGSISVQEATFSWPGTTTKPPPNPPIIEVKVSTGDDEGTDQSPDDHPTNATTAAAATQDRSTKKTQGFTLTDINMEIKPGTLVMIVGTVGSGKSSLLQALLGEMQQTSGCVRLNGDVSYVAQESWIRNATLKSNITFESAFDPERYDRVLEATQLLADLDALPERDLTEIGERGINLSGGQKARVSIARALYRESYDILILDDPLSAVDPHVAHGIFEECVMGLARSKTTLLVMNSHYDLLRYADRVVVVERGIIVGDGKYDDVVLEFPQLAATQTQQQEVEEDAIDETTERSPPVNEALEASNQQQHTHIYTPPHPVSQVHGDTDVVRERERDQAFGKPQQQSAHAGVLVQKEDRVKGRVKGNTYKTYFEETGFGAATVLLVITLGYTASQSMRVLVDWWQAYWAKHIQRASMSDSDSTYDASWFAAWYYGFIVICAVVTVSRSVMVMRLLLRSSTNLHNELFRRVLNAPVNSYFDVTPVGRILNRFSNDLDQMDSVLPQQYQNFVQNISLTVGGLAVCAASSYWIALSYVPILGALVFVGVYFKKSSREIKRLEGISRTPVYNLFNESLNGFQTIRAFKMQPVFDTLNKRAVDENATFYFTYWAAGRWLAVRLDTLSVVVIFVVSTYLVTTKGQLSAMIAGLSLTYAISLTSTIQSTIRDVDRTDNAMTSVERVLHFRDIPQEDAIADIPDQDLVDWPSAGAVRFDSLQLRYRPELPLVLQGVDMHIAGGEKVGICGRTGAGKSSLMVALFRICQFDRGSISIDGVDIQRVGLDKLRRSLAIIPQDPVLFSGSLRDNLDPFGGCSDDDIWQALRQVHLADAVTSWGGAGLDFEVAEKGDNLSVGQRQLVCIARALLKCSRIVVMDEATANVDSATDQLIQQTVKESFGTQTVLVIAHRIHTILHCDKIAVMAAGRVEEFGRPDELLGRPESLFALLAKRSGLLTH